MDLLREVNSLSTDGLQLGELALQPSSQPNSDFTPDFGWKPDGPYIMFARVLAIMFIVYEAVGSAGAPAAPDGSAGVLVPSWLSSDLSQLRAVYTHKRNLADRALSGCKA